MDEENIINGLTDEQVEEKIKKNLVNYDTSVPTKSIKQILANDFFTLFNLINLILGILIFSVGSYKNMLFLFIVIINTAISTFQEIHSKRVIDKLAVLASSKVKAIRNNKEIEIPIDKIVLDDVLLFESGNQIPTDCDIIQGEVEVDESFITGESDVIFKQKDEILLSGSIIVSGKCYAKVKHIGEENYTSQISSGAKYVKKVNSEIMSSLNKIIKILSIAIIPIGIALFLGQLQETTYKEAIVKTVAAVIGMIPEGLVLLTSTVLAVSVIRLSKSKVLVQELYCIETLARVDTLCLDKTGTLTEGKMEVKDFISIDISKEELSNILGNIAIASNDNNGTINAIRECFDINDQYVSEKIVPFSSRTKWSGVHFANRGSYVIGAPEFVLKNKIEEYKNIIDKYSKEYRIIVVAHSIEDFADKDLPNNLNVIGFVFIVDKIRKEAKDTLKYFKSQGVDIKIISGDNPVTVSNIAKRVGLEDYDQYIDASTIKTKEELREAAIRYSIFGRVTPTQKKELVLCLKENGKTVAMTGDGVNDVLALKESDCSIAMANGSDATKNVSQLILLDSNFASMPKVVAEGRRTINNIERSASLFLVKTIYSSILAILFIFMNEPYPFIPIQLTLISVVTIGIPSFVLALEPNKERIKGNFLKNVISRSLPTAISIILGILIISITKKVMLLPDNIYSTLCVISTGLCGILLLVTLTKTRKSEQSKLPVSIFRCVLCGVMSIIFVVGLTFFKDLFGIVDIRNIIPEVIKVCIMAVCVFILLMTVSRKMYEKSEK